MAKMPRPGPRLRARAPLTLSLPAALPSVLALTLTLPLPAPEFDLALVPTAAARTDADAAAAAVADAAELNAYLKALTALRADFDQTVRDERGDVVQRASGSMAMRRPGQFRWDYREPFAQLIVADGERIWLYDRDLEQVTVSDQRRALSAAPLAVLSGAAPVEDVFALAERSVADGLRRYRLLPRAASAGDGGAQSEFSELVLAFADTADAALRRIELVDAFGRRTELELTDVQINPSLDDALFRFVPPTGVDVVEG